MSDLRYKVISGSESANCCFEASIIDIKDIKDDSDGLNICECFEMVHAELIAKALNDMDKLTGDEE